MLDEPAAAQSDPALLNLQLRQLSKDTPGVRMEVVGRIEHDDKDKKQRLVSWISSIADIHKNKPAAAVRYSKPMPDMDVLMQASTGLRQHQVWLPSSKIHHLLGVLAASCAGCIEYHSMWIAQHTSFVGSIHMDSVSGSLSSCT